MLLGQETIPGYEFPYMRIVYALVMLIPLLYIVDILVTLRCIRFLRRNTQIPTQIQVTRYIGLPLILNTLGNLASGVSFEKLIFAPITLVLAFCAFRLAIEK